jgi:hypothetical protein
MIFSILVRRGILENYLQAKSDELSLFPGEHWFFYWRSSPSLWKSRIQEEIKSDLVVIPINWSAHCVESHQYDFGEVRPEANLKKLYQIIAELGLNPVFLFPMGPCPFLSNGGLPAFISSTPMVTSEGEILTSLDHMNQIHKMYSFYEPRVFQNYSRFLHGFKEMMQKEKILAPIILADYGYLKDGDFQSFFQDRSSCFAANYRRFVALKEQEGQADQASYLDFDKTVKDMYLTSARHQLKNSFSHVQKIVILGSAPADFHSRVLDNSHVPVICTNIMESIRKHYLVSSVLLTANEKKGFIEGMISNLFDINHSKKLLRMNFSEDDDYTQFNPLFSLNIVSPENLSVDKRTVLEEHMMNSVSEQSKDDFIQDVSNYRPVHMIASAQIDEKFLNLILRRLLDGQKILFYHSALNAGAQKRLEIFIAENNINVERLVFKEKLTSLSLNMGRLVIIDTDQVTNESDQRELWSRLFHSLEVRNLVVEAEKGILLSWKTRSPSNNELKFEEIRRLYLYNPTSYKLKAVMTTSGNYFLLKKIDEVNCKVEVHHPHIEISLLPKASLALDFGHIT